MRTIAVIPAYNEARGIYDVVTDVRRYVDEVIVVDDGSNDATTSLARSAGAVVLCHSINRGQGAALATGVALALEERADIIVHFDADGQHDAHDITLLTEPIRDGRADIVLGSRFLGHAVNLPLKRRILLKAGILFTRFFSGIYLSDTNNGLRAFSRSAATKLPIRHDGWAHASEILDGIADLKLRYVEVPVTVHYTPYSLAHGQSSVNALTIVRDLVIEKFFPHR
ncbi:MAG: glycosyltransferase family 2 protein [Patescibacteria group bacterium]|jgi:glycosyltransferase involved in cell wall biosynthesis